MKIKRENRIEFTSVSIPNTLFRKVEKKIEGTGFPSVSSYVAFIIRMVLSEKKNSVKDYDTEMVKEKLRALGYM
jgi:metal-responsive CopG/Arc/MetJ family transcriptional regulator